MLRLLCTNQSFFAHTPCNAPPLFIAQTTVLGNTRFPPDPPVLYTILRVERILGVNSLPIHTRHLVFTGLSMRLSVLSLPIHTRSSRIHRRFIIQRGHEHTRTGNRTQQAPLSPPSPSIHTRPPPRLHTTSSYSQDSACASQPSLYLYIHTRHHLFVFTGLSMRLSVLSLYIYSHPHTTYLYSQTVYNTKGSRAHTHKELIREWLWEPKGSSLEYI